jgi:predicted ATPase with chaperone activity
MANPATETAATIAPPLPATLAETGLPGTLMREILLKTMYRLSLTHVSELSRAVCLSFAQTQSLIDQARSEALIEATGNMQAGATSSEMGYQLTDVGKNYARSALALSEYYGAMPVTMEDYARQVRRQSIRDIKITRPQLEAAMGDLVLPKGLMDTLGPAVTSGRSILLYGPPGNGKSSISNGIRDAMGERIYVPRAVVHAGQVISVYDPIVHTLCETEIQQSASTLRLSSFRYDPRYLLCERPTVITGGELTLDMLELKFNPVARTY